MFKRVWIAKVCFDNWISYVWLVVYCNNLPPYADANQIRWLIRNFIPHCRSKGISPWNSEALEYKALFSFSIKGVIALGERDLSNARGLLLDALNGQSTLFVDTFY